MVYQWKQNRFGIDAQEAGEEMERIAACRGALTPGAIVDESRPKKAKLHGCFEWNNQKAADKYREVQAGKILHNLVTVSLDEEKEIPPTRAFVSIQNEYKPIDVVIQVKAYQQELLHAAIRELQSFQNKYKALTQLAGVFGEIEKLEFVEDAPHKAG